jgi:hypothetical protein
MTEHEDLGLDAQGRHMVKCCETGLIHEKPSQAARARDAVKKAERYKERTFNELMDSVRKDTGM